MFFKYGGLSIDCGLSMGDLVWLSEVGLFPATMRNFTKAIVWYSSVAVWPCMCELAGHFSVYHSFRTFLKIAPSAVAYLSLVCRPWSGWQGRAFSLDVSFARKAWPGFWGTWLLAQYTRGHTNISLPRKEDKLQGSVHICPFFQKPRP
jgi:hypothetical protein